MRAHGLKTTLDLSTAGGPVMRETKTRRSAPPSGPSSAEVRLRVRSSGGIGVAPRWAAEIYVRPADLGEISPLRSTFVLRRPYHLSRPMARVHHIRQASVGGPLPSVRRGTPRYTEIHTEVRAPLALHLGSQAIRTPLSLPERLA